MYLQKKKYFRLTLNISPQDRDEVLIWSTYNGDVDGLTTFLVGLNDLKNSGIKLSTWSLNILMLETVEEQIQFFEIARGAPPTTSDSAVCMTSIFTNQEGQGAQSQLIVGTEQGWIMVVNAMGNDFSLQVGFFYPSTNSKTCHLRSSHGEISPKIMLSTCWPGTTNSSTSVMARLGPLSPWKALPQISSK